MIEQPGRTHIVPHTASDEELARLFIETGDNRHFEKLYERYAYKVYKKCLFLIRDRYVAEDITQDIFVKVMSKMNTFKKDARFSTWLLSIACNHCRDLVRPGKKEVIIVYKDQVDVVDDSDVQRLFEDDEVDVAKLKKAITQLNLEEKAMIYLKYLDNKSIRDIAHLFMTTEAAVKMRLLRSRRKLRKNYLQEILFI